MRWVTIQNSLAHDAYDDLYSPGWRGKFTRLEGGTLDIGIIRDTAVPREELGAVFEESFTAPFEVRS